MATRSGISAQLGFATESAYGSGAVASRFLPFENESLALTPNYHTSTGLRGGRLVQAARLRKQTTRGVAGSIEMELFNQGMGALLNLLHGTTVTPEEVESGVFKQVHPIGTGDPFGKSATIQIGRPDTGEGVVRAFNYLGCKITSITFKVEAGGSMMVTMEIDGADEKLAAVIPLAEATYDADASPFLFGSNDASVGTSVEIGGEAAGNVLSLELKLGVPQKTDRYFLGAGGVKGEPIANALMPLECNATLEFQSMADHERFRDSDSFALAVDAVGDLIGESSKRFECNFDAPSCLQTASSPVIAGPDVVQQNVAFMLDDNEEEAPLSITYQSSDNAL